MPDWNTKGRPVLGAIYAATERQEGATSDSVAEHLSMDPDEVARIMSYLAGATPPYISVDLDYSQTTGGLMAIVTQLQPRALEELAGWPVHGLGGDAGARLLEAVEAQIAEASPAERPRLERLRDTLQEVGTGVLTGVLAKLATGSM